MAGPRGSAALPGRVRGSPAGRGDVEDRSRRRPRRHAGRRAGSRSLRPAGGGDPPLPPHGSPVDDRAADRGQPRLPGCARRAVPDLPGLGAVQEGAGLRHGGGARGDLPPVGADGRVGGPGLGRRDRRRPRQEDARGAPVVGVARPGGRERAGDPPRGDPLHGPDRGVRADRPDRRPRALHPPRPRRGRLAGDAPVHDHECHDVGRGGGARLAHPRPARAVRRRRPLRVLRRAGPRGRPHRLGLHRLVAEAEPDRPVLPRRAARDAAGRGRGGPHRGPRPRLPDALGAAGPQ